MTLSIETTKQSFFKGETIRVKTADGTMFVMILENERGIPCAVQATIGKAGSAVAAWCDATVRLCSKLIDKGTSIHELILELENITSDRQVQSGSVPIRSGIDGLVHALRSYQRSKRNRAAKALGL